MDSQAKVYRMGLNAARIAFGRLAKWSGATVKLPPIVHQSDERDAHDFARSSKESDLVVVGQDGIVHYSHGVATLV